MIDQPCFLLPASDRVVRCLPRDANGLLYADAQCRQPLIYPTTDLPELVSVYVPVATDVIYEVRSVGQPYTGSTVFERTPTGCNSIPKSGSYFFAGEVVPPESFEAATVHD